MKRLLTATGFFAVLLLAWHWACARGIWSPVLVPSPGSVARYLWSEAADGSLSEAVFVTLKRLLSGYFIGIVVEIGRAHV